MKSRRQKREREKQSWQRQTDPHHKSKTKKGKQQNKKTTRHAKRTSTKTTNARGAKITTASKTTMGGREGGRKG